ncbi:DUF3152 domain-containing protein [Streptomyces sp. NPDC047928]|uniref:DUF3152 domain-containing protein n=1 Tax=unclassified Streptomyces TaxID=2593676 RepID=UPI0037238EBA
MGKRAAAPRGRRSRRGRSGRGGRGGGARRPAARIVLAGLAVAVTSLGGGAALAHWQGTDSAAAASSTSPRPAVTGSAAASPEPGASRSAPASPPPRSTPPKTPPKPSTSSVKPPAVPASGAGTFTTARASGDKVGSGTLRRYRVQVEDGIELSAKEAAREIEQILAHPRSWAAHGRGSFQLVSENADFVIRIATPKTADRLCLAQGLNTRGELNCETADGVVVNLKRWMLGSPTFSGTPAEYRHLIINHEVGHEIGIRRHMGCPGPGRLAPVMMQQIKGLNGCLSNAWPYDGDGRYITGPDMP